MKNLIDPIVKNSIFNRIDNLNKKSFPKWGEMNVNQMLLHCDLQLKIAMGQYSAKDMSNILTKTIGKFLILNYENLTRKNLPTIKELNMVDKAIPFLPEIQHNKTSLKETINLLFEWNENISPVKKHPVFGKLTKKEWGRLAYIHINHHLKQFGQ